MDNIWLEKAIEIAVKAHKGQKDKAGESYILHPLFVMTCVQNNTQRIVAVLHDVIEDSDYTLEQLKEIGFSQEILDALNCLTHKKGENYFDYIQKIKSNEISKEIKKWDLYHNMDIRRLKTITEKDRLRIEKYEKAYDLLCE